MTDELVAWLREQVAEDERVAQAAGGLRWIRGEDSGWTGSFVIEDQAGVEVAGPGYEGGGVRSEEQAAHIARHDPARVLAEVAAKRRILELHLPWTGEQNDDGRYCSTCVGYPINSSGHIGVAWPCPTVRLLASVYRGRPGWRSEWAPDEEENRG